MIKISGLKGELTRMEVKMLANVRILYPAAQQEKRTLQRPARNNDLLCFDDNLSLRGITAVGPKVRVPGCPDTLNAAGHWPTIRLVEKNSAHIVALHELCACVRGIGQV